MSKLKVTTIANVADSESTDVTNVINGSAKAWVNFDGTFGTSPFTVANGGIRAAFNVSSITDNGTGDYTINFTTAMPDTNFAIVGSWNNGNEVNWRVPVPRVYSASSIRINTIYADANTQPGAYDGALINVAIFSN